MYEETWVKCELCGKGFDNYPALIAHIYKHFRDDVNFLRKRVAKLEEENALLRNALAQKVDDLEPTYREIEDRLDRLKTHILKAIRFLIRSRKRPVNYEEIIKAVQVRYPFKIKAETITRTVRKLKEEGYLFSPKKGYFMLSDTPPQEIGQQTLSSFK